MWKVIELAAFVVLFLMMMTFWALWRELGRRYRQLLAEDTAWRHGLPGILAVKPGPGTVLPDFDESEIPPMPKCSPPAGTIKGRTSGSSFLACWADHSLDDPDCLGCIELNNCREVRLDSDCYVHQEIKLRKEAELLRTIIENLRAEREKLRANADLMHRSITKATGEHKAQEKILNQKEAVILTSAKRHKINIDKTTHLAAEVERWKGITREKSKQIDNLENKIAELSKKIESMQDGNSESH